MLSRVASGSRRASSLARVRSGGMGRALATKRDSLAEEDPVAWVKSSRVLRLPGGLPKAETEV